MVNVCACLCWVPSSRFREITPVRKGPFKVRNFFRTSKPFFALRPLASWSVLLMRGCCEIRRLLFGVVGRKLPSNPPGRGGGGARCGGGGRRHVARPAVVGNSSNTSGAGDGLQSLLGRPGRCCVGLFGAGVGVFCFWGVVFVRGIASFFRCSVVFGAPAQWVTCVFA